MIKFIFLILTFVSYTSVAAPFNWSEVLFGVEYSFQDQEIVNEPGRATITTPYKQKKMNEFIAHYISLLKEISQI